MANFTNKFESKNQTYVTPDALFRRLDSEFKFTRDVCADVNNAKCFLYWTEENSCLDKTWDGINWMNPPYKTVGQFVKKAWEQSSNASTVCLVPARTNTNWWHEYCMKGEVRFIQGRIRFEGCKYGLPQPLAIVIFGGTHPGEMSTFNYREELLGWVK